MFGTLAVIAAFWLVFVSQLAAFELQGPELGAADPIMVLAALRMFWRTFGATLLFELALVLFSSIALWILLEALFRGGRRGFWIYLGTSAARLAFLGSTVIVFGLLASADEGIGALVVGGAFISALAFVLALVESLIRRNAIELLAVDLLNVAGVMGVLFSLEGLSGLAVLGTMAAVFLSASGGAEVFLAFVIGLIAIVFWMMIHSYLIAVRYTAIDIMRKHVVG